MGKSEGIVDYFYICGVDSSVGLETFSMSEKQTETYLNLPPLTRPYKCKVLQHFPEHAHGYPFDEESTALVTMPGGLKLCTQEFVLDHQLHKPLRHTFIITREDGTRVHGLAILFPEVVDNIELKDAVVALESMYDVEFNSPECHSDFATQRYNSKCDTLFAMKAIGLLSPHAFIHGLFGWLEDIWAHMYLSPYSMKHSIEAFIHNLLFKTKLPAIGHYVNFISPVREHFGYLPAPSAPINHLLNGKLINENPIELPLFEYSMKDVFDLISLDDFIRLLTCTLLEYRIILFSKVYFRLMSVAECMTSLLFPFNWPHVYAPILPVSLIHFLDAPVPFIMGINLLDTPSVDCCGRLNSYDQINHISHDRWQSATDLAIGILHESVGLQSEGNVCYVYIDEGRVVVPDEVPQFPNAQFIKETIVHTLNLNEELTEGRISVPTSSDLNSPPRNHNEQPESVFHRWYSAENAMYTSAPPPVLRPRPPNLLTNPSKSKLSFKNRRCSIDCGMKPGMAYIQQLTTGNVNYNTGDKVCDKIVNTGAKLPDSIHRLNYFLQCKEYVDRLVTTQDFPSYVQLLHLNTAVRNIFLKNFAVIFKDYDNFLALDKLDESADNKFYCGLQAFDKVGFLCDQPETHLPFLSAFLETQMFTSFLDTRLKWHLKLLPLKSDLTDPKLFNSSFINLPLFQSILSKLSANYVKLSSSDPFIQYLIQMNRTPQSEFPIFYRRKPASDESNRFCVLYEPLPDLLSGATGIGQTDDCDSHQINGNNICSNCDHYSVFPTLADCVLTQNLFSDSDIGCINSRLAISHPIDRDLCNVSLTPPARNTCPDGPKPVQLNGHLSITNSSAPVSPPCRLVMDHPGCLSTPTQRATPLGTMQTTEKALNSANHLTRTESKQNATTHNLKINKTLAHTHQLANLQRGGMAQANWDFVDALLEECKHRTKRMVLKQIGQEAVGMGHEDPTISIVEENTLVSGLCDLLERMWSHGLNKKLGKSTLWSHLLLFAKRHKPSKDKAKKHNFGDCEPTVDPSSLSSSSSSSLPSVSPPNSPCLSDFNNCSNKGKNNASTRQPSPELYKNSTSRNLSLSINSTTPFKINFNSLKRFRKCSHESTISSLNHPDDHFPWRDNQVGSNTLHNQMSTTQIPRSCKLRLQMPNMRPLTTSNGSRSASPSSSYFPNSKSTVSNSPLIRAGGPFCSDSTTTTTNNNNNTVSSSSVGMTMDLRKIFGNQLIEHSLVVDIEAIRSLKSVKTDVGFTRAFIRLALEKKLLSAHLTLLLMDSKLLRYLFNRYAFLRCEEEREQFLVYLLSLNAVDYYSFTRMINDTELLYQIFICSGRKHGFPFSANAWVKLNGHLSSTEIIPIPRGHNLIEIKNRNLGLLTTIQIGHDNAGATPRWFVEFVLIRNRITNHLYLFPCHHWFGLGIEDDALERVLIGEQIRLAPNDPNLVFTANLSDPMESIPNLPNHCFSPSLSRRSIDSKNLSALVIHERVAGAINRLLKYLYKSSRPNVTSLTSLWCGEHGLVAALHLVFNYAFRSSRLFQRRIFVWDYFEKVATGFAIEFSVFESTNSSSLDPSGPRSQSSKEPRDFSSLNLPRSVLTNRANSDVLFSRIRFTTSETKPRLMPTSPSFTLLQGITNTTFDSIKHSVLGKSNDSVDSSNLYSFSQPNSPAYSRLMTNHSTLKTVDAENLFTNRKTPELNNQSIVNNRELVLRFITSVGNVNQTSPTLGKEGKFQRFICRAIRDHLLTDWLSILALSPITAQLYESKSFILNHDLRQTVQCLLTALDEFQFTFDAAILGDSQY